MPSTDAATLDQLIDQLHAAVESDRNQARHRTPPPVLNAQMEDPIAWTVLFGFPAERYFTDPAFYLEQNLRQKLWKFENVEDDVPINLHVPAWLGHYPEYTFFDMDVQVNEKGVPRIRKDHPLTRTPDLSLLRPVDFGTSGWMPRAREWYGSLRELAGGRLSIGFMAWNRACLDLAMQLRGFEQLLLDSFERPEFVHGLLRFLVEQRNAWHDAQAAYLGTQVGQTWIADDWMAVPYISPGLFEEFVLPRYLDIERHHGAIGGLHSCGDQAPLQRMLLRIETLGALEVSPWTDLQQTLANVPESKFLVIAVHPNDVLVDSPLQMERKLRFIAEHTQGRSFSLSTSGLTPIYKDNREFLVRINRWLDIAREALGK
jgi:hypothetical protein